MSPAAPRTKTASKARASSKGKTAASSDITLVISEKQIAAERIAEILSDGKAERMGKEKIPIHRFQLDGREFRVVGLSGHVVVVDYPSELNRWYQVNPRDLIFADPIKRVPRGSAGLVRALRKAAEGAHEVIVATDFDREGELIGKEGIELLGPAAAQLRIRRARFSSLTPKEIHQSFAHPVELDQNLAAAGESRQYVDLAWGAVLTRIITMAAHNPGREVLSVGRVQSPTLALLVDLEKKIRAFQPQPYWILSARVGQEPGFLAFHLGPSKRTEADVENEEDEEGEEPKIPARAFADQAQAERIHRAILNEKTALIGAVERSVRAESAPTPFNTTAFLQAAASLGLSAGRAMNLAEQLYMRGFISYPRTDNTVYPPTEDLNALLEALTQARAFAPDVTYLASVRRDEPTRGKKTATDHPPIHPVEAASRGQLDDDLWKVYELVVRRFLATLAKDARGQNIRVDLTIGPEPFRSTGYTIEFWGWKKLYPYAGSEERPLPNVREGERIPVLEVLLEAKETQPPKRYGQGRLIAEMERLGLGTKSTRHDIIEKLLERHYVKGPKTLEPTEMGFAVTDALERYAEVITKPQMTAQLEEEMELVAEGKKLLPEVVADSRRLLEEAVSVLEKNHDQLSQDLSEAMRKQNTIGTCPRCGKSMTTIRSRAGKRFVGCTGYPECRQTYPLPQMGRVVPSGKCDACGAPEVKLFRAGRPPWELCINMECPKRPSRQAAAAAPAPVEGGNP